MCNRVQCFHFSGSLITGIPTGMVYWTKTRLAEWLSRRKTAWWAFWSHVITTINPESAKKNGARVSHLLCVVSAHALDCGVSRSYQPLLVSLFSFVFFNVTVTRSSHTTEQQQQHFISFWKEQYFKHWQPAVSIANRGGLSEIRTNINSRPRNIQLKEKERSKYVYNLPPNHTAF